LRRGIGGDPSTLDPGYAIDSFSLEIIRDLYEGLVSERADGSISPGVASDWTVDPSGRIYVFTIRPNAKWSNGMPVTAYDFIKSWRRVIDPSNASPASEILQPIANALQIIKGDLRPDALAVSASDSRTLRVRLEQPAPYFPQLLTHAATFPVFSDASTKTHNASEWVSNGPYVLARWVPGSKISLTKNDFYWNHDFIAIKVVDYIPSADENSELRQYRAGQLDVTQSVPVGALASIRRDIPNELLVAPFLGVAYYAMNVRTDGLLRDPRLRQALAMAIDRKKLQATLLTFGQAPAYGFVPPGTWNYRSQNWEWMEQEKSAREDQARRLYYEAGYTKIRPLKLRLLYNSNSSIKQVSIAITAMWNEVLGVETELVEEEYRVFLDSRKDPKRWDIARLAWAADYNDAGDFLGTFQSNSPNNDSGYSNPSFDSLIDQAAKTADSDQRRKTLEKAEKLMLDDYPVVPVYFYCSKRLIKPYVIGAKTNPLGRLYSQHLRFIN
jgi:oligopeptide transport system substrate-binding protein